MTIITGYGSRFDPAAVERAIIVDCRVGVRAGAMLLAMITPAVTCAAQPPTATEVRAAMARATTFMMDTVSRNGGFVWKYSLDLKQRYGELKARDSMIWVEPPGTPTVGLMLLEAHRVTGGGPALPRIRRPSRYGADPRPTSLRRLALLY